MKLHNWTVLPWLLCGLACSDEDLARDMGRKSLAQFDNAPESEAVHHRVTMTFCSHIGHSVRNQLEQFVNGTPREALPELHLAIAALFFIPITERCIEEPHSRVKRVISYRNHGTCHRCLSTARTSLVRRSWSTALKVSPLVCVLAPIRILVHRPPAHRAQLVSD